MLKLLFNTNPNPIPNCDGLLE